MEKKAKGKINLNVQVKDIEGEVLKDEVDKPLLLNKVLAQHLSRKSDGDALKLFFWAKKLYEGEELDMDVSDLQMFKAAIQSLPLFALVKGQALEIIAKFEG